MASTAKVDLVPYGHDSLIAWGDPEEDVQEVETNPFGDTDPLTTFRVEGTEFTTPDDLMEHQKEDVRKILQSGQNFLVLSEMGVGKTPEAISVAMGLKAKNVLVLVPKSLRLEWARQIEQWTGVQPVVCRRGSGRRLNPLFEEKFLPSMEGKEVSPFFILNYDTFRKKEHRTQLTKFPWDLIIMDEVHHLRNADTQTTKGVYECLEGQKNAKILMLSGSPIVNTPLDFYTFLRMQNSGKYTVKNRIEWLNRYTYFNMSMGKIKVLGTRNEKGFRDEIAPFTIQRKKEDVLKFLPAKIEAIKSLEMEDDQRDIYDSIASQLMILLDDGEEFGAPGVLAALTRLRQIILDPRIIGRTTSSSKTEYLLELVEDFRNNSIDGKPRKLVVFSTFKEYIDILAKDLDRLEVKYVSFTGDTHADKRAPQVKAFQEDPKVQLAIGTIQSMGEGITLTAASDVVLMDRWWTPAANAQAVDRLHRPGQEKSVQIIMPSNDKSIDQTLDEILASKKRMMDSLLSDTGIMEEFLNSFRNSHYSLTAV